MREVTLAELDKLIDALLTDHAPFDVDGYYKFRLSPREAQVFTKQADARCRQPAKVHADPRWFERDEDFLGTYRCALLVRARKD